VLTPLQERIRLALVDVAGDAELALAGGGGLVVSGVVDRRTQDLDFFARYPSPHPEVVDLVQGALEAAGLTVTREEDKATFARLQVTSGDDVTTVDIGADFRLSPAVRIRESTVLALNDLAADKVLTLWARALPRDFVDFAALTERFSVSKLCALAAEKDAGFRPLGLADILQAFPNRPASRYAEFPVDYEDLSATIAAAAERIRHLVPSPDPSDLNT